MNDFFSWARLAEELPLILMRLPVTLSIVFVATTGGLILGTIAAVIRLAKAPALYQITSTGISFFRGTPIIVQLFVVYFGLPVLLKVFGVNANRWPKLFFVCITYSLNMSAFLSEIIRSAISSVDAGQREAAYSVGLTSSQAFFRVVAPQAVLIALPSFSVSLLALLQNTSLGFTIGLIDMVGQVRAIAIRTHHVFEGYIAAAAIFVLLSILFNFLLSLLEKKLKSKIFKEERRGI
ncbi:amino acid ABC transporter permease [Treponema endosymbiont of Eucomonympha sp.]|uniref:amino acid ABC transporter permease n=1 Tax=Treponema endosymbiont of Eucomonympha sp. TaxID=1580831 RepID=UPI0007825B3C|nr:amino acid ABC transporter permease [Treponema endosymbiont of Eucomonympha sp.]